MMHLLWDIMRDMRRLLSVMQVLRVRIMRLQIPGISQCPVRFRLRKQIRAPT